MAKTIKKERLLELRTQLEFMSPSDIRRFREQRPEQYKKIMKLKPNRNEILYTFSSRENGLLTGEST